MRRTLIAMTLVLLPAASWAGPKEEADQTVQKFISLFNAANDLDGIVGLFSSDAQFWGTLSPDLGTSPDAIRKYFATSFAARATAPTVASVVGESINIISDDTALVAGRWQLDRASGINSLRFSAVLNRQNGRWQFVQFHSSPRPSPQ